MESLDGARDERAMVTAVLLQLPLGNGVGKLINSRSTQAKEHDSQKYLGVNLKTRFSVWRNNVVTGGYREDPKSYLPFSGHQAFDHLGSPW